MLHLCLAACNVKHPHNGQPENLTLHIYPTPKPDFFLTRNPALMSVADGLNLQLSYIVEHPYTVFLWVLLFHGT